ncbi:MAG: periplasmic heavy metal sensor [Hyphomonas sp.]
MSDMPQKRQLPFWLMLSVMINLALLGLAAGLLLKRSDHRPPKHADRHGERSLTEHEDYKFVGEVIREAFAAAEPELQARREAGKALGTVVAADPIDMDDVRVKILKMREADEALHDALDAAIVPRLETMTVRQRAVFARTLSRDRSRNLRGRNKGDKRDKWRKKVRRDGMGDMPPPPPPMEVPEFEKD